jgi:hypothetical protein
VARGIRCASCCCATAVPLQTGVFESESLQRSQRTKGEMKYAGAPDSHGRSFGTESRSVTRPRRRISFFAAMSAAILLLVLAGFGPTLYFRAYFDVPAVPNYLLVHGVVLTAWFVAFCLQTLLVAFRRADLHRQAGVIGIVMGAGVVVVGLAVTPGILPTLTGTGGDVTTSLPRLSRVFWADCGLLLCFAVFLSTAVAFRRRPEVHRRLMLLASISLLAPAVARIGRWPMFIDIDQFSLWVLLLLLAAIGLHDITSTKRLHIVTLVGAPFFIIVRIVTTSFLPTSEFGMSFVRELFAA